MSLFRSARATAAVAALVLSLASCSRRQAADAAESEVELGSAVSVGALTYTVIDQRWHESLNASTGPRLPQHRFFSASVSVTNGGADPAGVPLMTLVASDGKEYQELSNGDGLPGWLGYMRIVNPAQTEHGRILFDVPPGAYKLRVSSGGEPEKEITALVKIPFQVEAPASAGEETLTPSNP